mgnify:CR=1 FL=1
MARPAAMGKFRAEGQPKGSPGHSPAHTHAREVLVLGQKLKLGALLWVCCLWGHVAGACGACVASGAC